MSGKRRAARTLANRGFFGLGEGFWGREQKAGERAQTALSLTALIRRISFSLAARQCGRQSRDALDPHLLSSRKLTPARLEREHDARERATPIPKPLTHAPARALPRQWRFGDLVHRHRAGVLSDAARAGRSIRFRAAS
ncbi:hypothetical protein MPC1_11110002 [Methylocella tundrae]|nr:hypothetical protein MPC1_11110002 [Methylocella tundrae]